MPESSHPRTPAAAEQTFSEVEERFHDYEFPKVSIIIPAYNAASTISITIEHLLVQDYPDFEILIIDAGSKDRTLEIVEGYRDEKIQIFSVSGYHRYEMMNKGIAQATGQYLNFLFPGDYYLYHDTLKYMMGVALKHQKPNLVFCGTLIRDTRDEVRTFFSHMTPRVLRQGIQPTSLQSCWFNEETFHEIGKFNPQFAGRGGYDLMCRYVLHGRLRSVSVKRVLIDYDLRTIQKEMVAVNFWETFSTVFKYFGLIAACRWLLTQREWVRYLQVKWRKVKMAFGIQS